MRIPLSRHCEERPASTPVPACLRARGLGTAVLVGAILLAGCGDNRAPARDRGQAGPAREAPAGDRTEAAGRSAPAATPMATPTGNARADVASPVDDRQAAAGPRVALVIDDLGQRLTGPAAELLALPVPLTLAVLPGLPHSREVAAQAARGIDEPTAARRELLLHLPMQPLDYPATDPGPGALLVGMDPVEAVARLDRALAAVPGATGVNNHMGSAATADSLLMSVLMEALAARGLRFLDSLTTPHSVAAQAARRAGVPCARNRLFLDADPADEATISARLAELVAVARHAGSAIGIGHPHAATAAVLAREVPRLEAEGVRFVTVSELSTAGGGAPLPAAGAVSGTGPASGESHAR